MCWLLPCLLGKNASPKHGKENKLYLGLELSGSACHSKEDVAASKDGMVAGDQLGTLNP